MTTEPRPPADASEHDRPDYIAGVDERPQRRREWGGSLQSVVLPLLIVVVIVGGVWYLQQRRDSGGAATENGTGAVTLPAAKNPTGKEAVPEVGRAAPDFILKKLDGSSVRLSDLRGKPVILNFWATWCGPCRAEIPELIKSYAEQSGAGLEVVAIDVQEPEPAVRDFVAEFGMPFPVVIDRGSVAESYRVGSGGLPTSYFIDKTGVIRAIKLGAMTGDYLRDQLARLQN